MKTSRIALVAALSLGVTTIGFPQDQDRKGPGHGRGGPGGMPHSPVVIALDVNKDATLSAEEIANAAANLKTLDKNNDGALSLDEIRPARPANAPDTPPTPPPGRMHRANPVMLALDADDDHALSATEIANAPSSLKALDANKDGQLTIDELRPLPPEGQGQRRHGGNRPPKGE